MSTLPRVPGSNPTTTRNNDTTDTRREKYTRTERGKGVREPKRLGMSQGTMNRDPKYGGGAHPKYGSCRGISESNPESMY